MSFLRKYLLLVPALLIATFASAEKPQVSPGDPFPQEETSHGRALEEAEELSEGAAVKQEYDPFPFKPTPYLKQKRCWPEEVRRKAGISPNLCWHPKFDDYTKAVLTDDSPFLTVAEAPSGVEEICPNYALRKSKEERKAFWAYFMQALAVPESDFDRMNSTLTYAAENGKPALYSRGLFQLSVETDAHRSGCEALRTRGVFDPKANIQCAMAILKWQLYKQGKDGKYVLNHPLFAQTVKQKSGRYLPPIYWTPLWKLGGAESCMKKIPGYNPKKPSDFSNISPEYRGNILGCQGLHFRRILSQFWESYPFEKGVGGKNLCGLSNYLGDMCGPVPACAELPEAKEKPKRGKRPILPNS